MSECTQSHGTLLLGLLVFSAPVALLTSLILDFTLLWWWPGPDTTVHSLHHRIIDCSWINLLTSQLPSLLLSVGTCVAASTWICVNWIRPWTDLYHFWTWTLKLSYKIVKNVCAGGIPVLWRGEKFSFIFLPQCYVTATTTGMLCGGGIDWFRLLNFRSGPSPRFSQWMFLQFLCANHSSLLWWGVVRQMGWRTAFLGCL